MPLDGSKLRAIEFGLTALGERLESLERARTHRSDDFQEHKHPRGPDGKFTSGSGGSAIKQAAHKYIQGLLSKGNKPKQQGFTKHLLEQGFPAKAVAAAVEEEFGEEKPHAYVKGIHGKFKKLISDFPALNHEEWSEKYHGEPEAAGEKAGALPEIPANINKYELPDAKLILGWADGSDTDYLGWDHPQQAIESFAKSCGPDGKEYAAKVLAAMGPAPSSPAPSAPAAEQPPATEPAQAPAASPAQAKGQLSPETKSIYQKNIDGWQNSMKNGDYELKKKFDEVMAAQLESDPTKKQEMLEALKPIELQSWSDHVDSMNEFITGIKAAAGAGASEGSSAATDPERVLPPKPALSASAMPEPPADLGTGDIIKKVALGQFPSTGQSPAEQLQSLIDGSSTKLEEKVYAQKLLDHLNGETSAPEPASAAAEPEGVLPATKTNEIPEPPKEVKDFNSIKKIHAMMKGEMPPPDGFASVKDYLKNVDSEEYYKPGGIAEGYIKTLLNHLNDQEGGAASSSALVAPDHKLSAETHKELAENAQHWDKIGPSLKPAVDEKHNELKAALAHPTAAAQKNAIAALKPIENPSGMGQKSMNAFIAKVQNEYGVAPQPSTTAPTASPTPAQQAKAQTNVAAALKKAPHKVIKHINELEDHTGAIVQAKHIAETSKILGDHYHKVTAAYGNSQDAMTDAVNKAMTSYWKDIDKTWDSDTKNALYDYQDGYSKKINDHFLSAGKNSDESTKAKVASMQKALEHSLVPADTPAWRGLNCSMKDLTGFDHNNMDKAIGRCFEHRNFASISRGKNTSLSFGSNVLMKMTIPAGTPGLVVGGQTEGDGGKQYEKEIILGPRSMWRIDKYEKGAQGANHLIHVTYLGERTDEMHDISATAKDS